MMVFTNFQAKELGETHFDVTTSTNLAPLDPVTATSPLDSEFVAYNNLIIARFNLLENTINGYSNPYC